VVHEIAQLVGNGVMPTMGAIPDRPQERVRVADVKPAFEKLHWRPATSLEDGLKKTIDWYNAFLKGVKK
jgi:nucleoside-diphosphate-sugar epimerase